MVEGSRIVIYNDGGAPKQVVYPQGSDMMPMFIDDVRAFGKTLSEAYNAGYISVVGTVTGQNLVSYSTLVDKVVKNATVEI